jgi:hypothetical protein
VLLYLEVGPNQVIDCRIRNLAVPTAWPPSAGQILTIQLNTSQRPRPTLRVEVVQCALKAGHWILRGRLVTPSWDELLRALGHSVR